MNLLFNDFDNLPSNLTRSYDFSEPTRLDEALLQCKKKDCNDLEDKKFLDSFLRDIDKDEEIASTKVKRYIARGSSAIVFETCEGDVLKLTRGNHFPLNRPQESFDVPIIKKGRLGHVWYYLEEKLSQRGLSEGFVLNVKEKIKQAGYRCSDIGDYDTHQIGLSTKGQLYLLDPECAKYKTVFHALFDKVRRFLK